MILSANGGDDNTLVLVCSGPVGGIVSTGNIILDGDSAHIDDVAILEPNEIQLVLDTPTEVGQTVLIPVGELVTLNQVELPWSGVVTGD